MNDFEIKFNVESPQKPNEKIVICAVDKPEEGMLYKYFVGLDGKWNLLKDFSKDTEVKWHPKEDGVYTIMIQARREGENKPFNCLSKTQYIIGNIDNKFINQIILDKEELTLGEKITAKVQTSSVGVLFKYEIRQNDNWILLKDYSADDVITWTATKVGEQELIVQCKQMDSKKKYDDIERIPFNVMPISKIEISDFTCLTQELLMDSEITFEVDIKYDDSRLVLYKFIKIDAEGHGECIQNYSTKRMVSYVEKGFGKFKILCMVKDMYSPEEYDERAIIAYNVKKYRPVNIKSFTTDVSSPQSTESDINFKAVVNGGRNILYRYVIEGCESKDTGYVKNDIFTWKPKEAGAYKIKLMVKDLSYEGDFEDTSDMDFVVDDVSYDPVVIKEIIRDKRDKILVGETINVKAIAQGGSDLRYAFNVKDTEGNVEKISYGTCNWVNYTAEKSGDYELEVMVKDKFSKKEYDSHSFVYIQALKYIPAKINYVLLPYNDHYMVGDKIELTVVSENTKNVLNKYTLKINDRIVEETQYIGDSRYIFTPKFAGFYEVEIFSKSKNSDKDFDCKKSVKIRMFDALPITNTLIECDKIKRTVNESINFSVSCDGGREIMYEFYLYENGEWSIVQKYSRKSYYTFIPFKTGNYKILVLTKSQFKKIAYEDYTILQFEVEK
jgi:hypothetical protein